MLKLRFRLTLIPNGRMRRSIYRGVFPGDGPPYRGSKCSGSISSANLIVSARIEFGVVSNPVDADFPSPKEELRERLTDGPVLSTRKFRRFLS